MKLIPYEEAIDRTLRGIGRLALERVSLGEACERVLAEDLVAGEPMPPFSSSAMDGYAVRASTFGGDGPWRLPVRGESRAGRTGPALEAGCAERIFTGAVVPEGANAVILQEDVQRDGDTITVRDMPREGQNIRFEGSDLARGSKAMEAGEVIHPGRLGLLASLDRAFVLVARRPVVSLLTTGDELRWPGTPGPAGSIPESNSFVIAAIAKRLGAVCRTLPLVADEAERTEQDLRRAMRGSDLVVTIGGASVGDHDLVRPALESIGVNVDFWGVAIKPGKPVGVGSLSGCKFLSLPGNPASASLTFTLFGVPLLRAMQGHRHPKLPRAAMRVVGSHVRKPGREEYLRARLELHDGERCAVLRTSQSSGAVPSFAGADALVVLAADRPRIENGDRLPVMQLSELWSL